MAESCTENGGASWRRRRPVLSRVLLYGAGAVLVALAAFLLLRRQEQDREDRLRMLEARLDTLDVLFVLDPAGDEVRKVLDEEFSDPDLPPRIRHRVLRAQAFSHLKRGEGEETLAALDAAALLATDVRDRIGIRIERAQALAYVGRAQEALAALDGLDTAGEPVLTLWRSLVEAQALGTLGRQAEGRERLDDGLEGLPRPLPERDPVTFGLTPYTPPEVALFATKGLADLGASPGDPRIWVRLLELAPGDPTVVLEAAKALWRGGHQAEARDAWGRALVLCGPDTLEKAAADPDLSALARNRAEGLKTNGEGGR